MNNYAKAYSEILEILKYIPVQDKCKIPDDILQTFTEYSDKNYNFNINTSIPFEDNILLEETKSILAVLFRDYWATDFQIEQILAKEKIDIKEYEQTLNTPFNYSSLFRENNDSNNQLDLIDCPIKEKWYKKFINFIKDFFTH